MLFSVKKCEICLLFLLFFFLKQCYLKALLAMPPFWKGSVSPFTKRITQFANTVLFISGSKSKTSHWSNSQTQKKTRISGWPKTEIPCVAQIPAGKLSTVAHSVIILIAHFFPSTSLAKTASFTDIHSSQEAQGRRFKLPQPICKQIYKKFFDKNSENERIRADQNMKKKSMLPVWHHEVTVIHYLWKECKKMLSYVHGQYSSSKVL